MNTVTNNDLTPYNGLGIKARAKRFEKIDSIKRLLEVIATLGADEPIHILGDGTNTVWGSPFINRVVLKIEIPGFEILGQNKDTTSVRIGAGENWDEVVARTVKLGLSGIEALSGIPGTAGAGPVQNIGAYGQELADSLEELTVFDRESAEWKTFNRDACRFGYRDSIFKHEARELIIVDITLCLSNNHRLTPNYPDIIDYFRDKDISSPTLANIRNAVLEIRSKKLPDPKVIPNCGSFCKNPIVKKEIGLAIQNKFPTIPLYPVGNTGLTKIPAAWLLDMLGFKGKQLNNIEIYKNHALILTNPKRKANTRDVLSVQNYIVKKVRETFDITLDVEPEIVS